MPELFQVLLLSGAQITLGGPAAPSAVQFITSWLALAFVDAVLFGASQSFLSPVGYQTNLKVSGPGRYRFLDISR
jgi:di/tricarboxylate transporter